MLKQLIIVSLAIASVAGAAQAQESDTRAVKVSISGIDTHSESGARVMLERIKVAARSVCGPSPSNAMDRYAQYDPCVQGVTQRTVDGLNNPFLTAALTKGGAPRTLASAR